MSELVVGQLQEVFYDETIESPPSDSVSILLDDLGANDNQREWVGSYLKSVEKPFIQEYLNNSNGNHGFSNLKVVESFEVNRPTEALDFWKGMHNRSLLWHGTSKTNIFSILRDGFDLKFAKSSGMFGKGIYFSDCCTKSLNYCHNISSMIYGQGNNNSNNNHIYLLLCEVALGTIKKCKGALYNAENTLNDEDSVLGEGMYSTTNGTYDEDEVMICPGKLKPTKTGAGLMYNEYIVYNTNQIRLRYLVKISADQVTSNLFSNMPAGLNNFINGNMFNTGLPYLSPLPPLVQQPTQVRKVTKRNAVPLTTNQPAVNQQLPSTSNVNIPPTSNVNIPGPSTAATAPPVRGRKRKAAVPANFQGSKRPFLNNGTPSAAQQVSFSTPTFSIPTQANAPPAQSTVNSLPTYVPNFTYPNIQPSSFLTRYQFLNNTYLAPNYPTFQSYQNNMSTLSFQSAPSTSLFPNPQSSTSASIQNQLPSTSLLPNPQLPSLNQRISSTAASTNTAFAQQSGSTVPSTSNVSTPQQQQLNETFPSINCPLYANFAPPNVDPLDLIAKKKKKSGEDDDDVQTLCAYCDTYHA